MRIPKGVVFGGGLDLSGLKEVIVEGPLQVDGTLNLSHSGVERFPHGLIVGGSLDLEGCWNLKELPPGLTVGRALDLDRSTIRWLPEGLKVGYDVYLSGSWIRELRECSHFPGNLDLSNCKDLINLPYALKVGGNLDLRGSGVRILPPGLEVGGALLTDKRSF